MKPAPLQLIDYFITALHLEANPAFDRNNENQIAITLDTLHVDHQVVQDGVTDENGSEWLVKMRIKQDLSEGETNIPYRFDLELQGRVLAFPVFKEDRLKEVVSANAPAMLFGAAREIIRAATGRGPFPPVIIPSTNFLDSKPKAKKAAKKVSKKKSTKKEVARKTVAGKERGKQRV